MEDLFLAAESRTELGRGKVKDLREAGFIPAVVYKEGKTSLPIKVSHRGLIQLIHQHRIESVVINLQLEVEKKNKTRPCIIKEIQYHPVTGDIVHVDFNEISLTKAIKVNVPVLAKGEPVGVKQEGGSVEHILWEVEVECLPTDIPKEIVVDVSNLKIGDSIHIKDISVPAQVKILNDPSEIILSVSAPIKEEVVAEAIEGEEKHEPEVIKEKKEVAKEEEAKEEDKKA